MRGRSLREQPLLSSSPGWAAVSQDALGELHDGSSGHTPVQQESRLGSRQPRRARGPA